MAKKTNDSNAPVLMTEEYWANSPLSIARYYGTIKAFGCSYIIINKEGKDIFELSAIADKLGKDKAIEPGEPADLICRDFISFYKKLGREAFIAVLEKHPETPHSELKEIFKEMTSKPQKKNNQTEIKL